MHFSAPVIFTIVLLVVIILVAVFAGPYDPRNRRK